MPKVKNKPQNRSVYFAIFDPREVTTAKKNLYQLFFKMCMLGNLDAAQHLAPQINLNVGIREENEPTYTYLPLFHHGINNGIASSFPVNIIKFFIENLKNDINGHASFHNSLIHWRQNPDETYYAEVLSAFLASPYFDVKQFVFDNHGQKEGVLLALLIALKHEITFLNENYLGSQCAEKIAQVKNTLLPMIRLVIEKTAFTEDLLTSKEISCASEISGGNSVLDILNAKFPTHTQNLLTQLAQNSEQTIELSQNHLMPGAPTPKFLTKTSGYSSH
jgi:hypothetical protein